MFFTSIIAGLGTALGWGAGDLTSKIIVDEDGAYPPMLALQAAMVLLISLLWIFLGWPLIIQTKGSMLIMLGSLFSLIAWFLYYQALQVGKAGLICTIYNLYALIPFFWQIATGTLKPQALHFLAILILIMGGILVSLNFTELGQIKIIKGLGHILGAVLFIGIYIIISDQAINDIGWQSSFYQAQLFGLIFLLIGLRVIKQLHNQIIPSGRKRLALYQIAYIFAWICLNWGMENGEVGIVSLVSTTSPIITALLATLLLKEKLIRTQYLGIALSILGVIALGI